jgi:prepilin peptidase CpaA
MIPIAIYLFILFELLIVSYGDVKTQKIPNLWAIINICAYLILVFILPTHYSFNFSTFIYSIAFLFVGFFLFLIKIMGAGDSKYLFSFFLLIPASLHEVTLQYLLLSTVLIGVFMLINNIFKNFDKIILSLKNKDRAGLRGCFGTKFSYAPVILVTWIMMGWHLNILIW